MKKFLATYGTAIVGLILQYLGASLFIMILGMLLTGVIILITWTIDALISIPTPEEQAISAKANAESPEYLAKYLPKS